MTFRRLVAFSLATTLATADSSIHTLSFNPHRCALIRELSCGNDFALSLATSPDGRTAAVGRRDGTILLVDLIQGAQRNILRGHTGYVSAVAFSPDGRTLASGGMDGNVRIWEPEAARALRFVGTQPSAVHSLAFSKIGTLASAGEGVMAVWDLQPLRLRNQWQEKSANIYTLAFQPDGRALAAGDASGRIHLWDLSEPAPQRTLEAHTVWIYALAFSPDGAILVSTALDGAIRLWDPARGVMKNEFHQKDGAYGVVFTSNRTLICGGKRAAWIWNPLTGTCLGMLDHPAEVYGTLLCANGSLVITLGGDNHLRFWGPTPRPPERKPESRKSGFLGVSYSDAEGGGALIRSIIADSQAEKTGFQPGDIIIQVNSIGIEKSQDFLEYMKQTFEGEEIHILLKRNEDIKTIRAKLGTWAGR